MLPSLTAARRIELYALAARYGLNPSSSDFAAIVQSLRATGQAMGSQDTVIYFGDDDVWVDSAVRERLEQMRISFRKIGHADVNHPTDPNLVSLGHSPKAESIGNLKQFDDRWVPSRRINANDIDSDTPTQAAEPRNPVEARPIAPQVYSLLAATKGAQVDGLVTQIPVISSDQLSTTSSSTPTVVYSSAPPVATVSALSLQIDEDSLLSFNYSQLARDAQLSLQITNETLRLRVIGIRRALHGNVQLDDDSGRLSFKPQADYIGTAGFTYVLADQYGRSYERGERCTPYRG
jgi:hypothetical protein